MRNTFFTPQTAVIVAAILLMPSYNMGNDQPPSGGDGGDGGDGGVGIVSNPGAGVTFGGYSYATVVLGNGQEWLAENLRTTTYANGDPIPNVTDGLQWIGQTTGAWVHYEDDASHLNSLLVQVKNPKNEQIAADYGKLYNWFAVADPRNVCPTAWHVPTKAEWSALLSYLDPAYKVNDQTSYTAGGKMKSTGTQYWKSPNNGATNESGFSGLPGGQRYGNGGYFTELGSQGNWWTATEDAEGVQGENGAEEAKFFRLHFNTNRMERFSSDKRTGLCVRCVRD